MKKLLLLFVLFTFSCEGEPTDVDVLISGGMIHDGTGINGYIGNVAINNDTIYYVGKKNNFIAKNFKPNILFFLLYSPSIILSYLFGDMIGVDGLI